FRQVCGVAYLPYRDLIRAERFQISNKVCAALLRKSNNLDVQRLKTFIVKHARYGKTIAPIISGTTVNCYAIILLGKLAYERTYKRSGRLFHQVKGADLC